MRIIRRCRATNITLAANGEWIVDSEQGAIWCEHVVNAGGTYARQMGEWSGLLIPTTSMTHHYFVTEPVPEFAELAAELPVVRDDRQVSGYIRMAQKRGLIASMRSETPIQFGSNIARGRPRTSCSKPATTASCRGWAMP